jgi:hypothetical protein
MGKWSKIRLMRVPIALRPNVSGPVLAPPDQRTIDNYFNKANITIPTLDQPFGVGAEAVCSDDVVRCSDIKVGDATGRRRCEAARRPWGGHRSRNMKFAAG